jgi:hypothetical protein
VPNNPARAAVAEGLGTALLLAAVLGSGIMGARLAGGNVAVVVRRLASPASTPMAGRRPETTARGARSPMSHRG